MLPCCFCDLSDTVTSGTATGTLSPLTTEQYWVDAGYEGGKKWAVLWAFEAAGHGSV